MSELETKTDRSLGDLVHDLTTETTTLVRQEIALAKTEMSQKAGRFAMDLAFIAAGGLVAYAGLLALLGAAVFGLRAAGLPLWGAALLVGLVVAAAGGMMTMRGVGAMKRESLAPRQAVDSVKEDVKWMKEQTQ